MTRMNLKVIASLLSGAAFAEEYVVDDAIELAGNPSAPFAAYTVKAQTHVQSSYPDDVGQPVFWFDARRTNGWTFASENGARTVTDIPSLVGSRSVSTSVKGGDFSAWTPKAPFYAYDAELGANVVDFGPLKSVRSLCFDPDSEGKTRLSGLGTVVAVYCSQNGGGEFLGATAGNMLCWMRGSPFVGTSAYDVYFSNPLANGSYFSASGMKGVMRHDGLPTDPLYNGFNGGWEVVSLQAVAADMEAGGFGLGDARAGMQDWYTGGQKIAEVIMFDKVLTDGQLDKVEAYLRTKWLAAPRGWNGNACLASLDCPSVNVDSGAVVTLDVPKSETLTVSQIKGCSGKTGGLLKTGEGTLVLQGVENLSSTVTLAGGTLAFRVRDIPTADGLPRDCYMRFDASDLSSLAFKQDDASLVEVWRNQLDTRLGGTRICLRPMDRTRHPRFLENGFCVGKHVIDFGAAGWNSPAMRFATDETAENPTEKSVASIATVFAVIGAQEGGGTLFGSASFLRNNLWNASLIISQNLRSGATEKTPIDPVDGTIFIDGVRADPNRGYVTPGYQVVGFKVPTERNIQNLMRTTSGFCGGARLGELVVYTRPLSDEEMRDEEAYLLWKWFGRVAPGYRRPQADGVPDVQNLAVTADSSVNVPAGVTVRVAKLMLGAKLVKTGEGVLEVCSHVKDDGGIILAAGEVAGVAFPDVASATDFAVRPSLHLDATRADLMDTSVENGREYVSRWYDCNHQNAGVATKDACRPWINRTDTCNGLPVLDFGPLNATGADSRYMVLPKPLDSVRSAYIVLGTQNPGNGGFFFGSSDAFGEICGVYNIDWHRGSSSPNVWDRFHSSDKGTEAVYGGQWLTNGVPVAYSDNIDTNAYMLLEIHTKAGAHVSALMAELSEYYGSRRGGGRIGEVLVYERELTEREKVSTRNHLMKKWFGQANPTELPDALPICPVDPDVLTVNGSLAWDRAEDCHVGLLTGLGRFEKNGLGKLTVADTSAFTGTVKVVAGTLGLAGATVPVAPKLAERGRTLHLDATEGIFIATSGGVPYVREWTSRLHDGWSAVNVGAPDYLARDETLGGRPSVSMPYPACMRFRKDGQDAYLENIRSVFWIIGSQEGGGYLLGGGTNVVYGNRWPWIRGSQRGPEGEWGPLNPRASLVSPQAQQSLQTADWRLNGGEADPLTDGLSGAWDQVTLRIADGEAANAEGLAVDGRYLHDTTQAKDYRGRQRLAELVVYDRVLSDEETAQVESYLDCKWFGMHLKSDGLDIELNEAAELDLGGEKQCIASVSGSGTVVNGTLEAQRIVYDVAQGEAVTVQGVFSVPEKVEILLTNVAAIPEDGGKFVVLKTSKVLGGVNLLQADILCDAELRDRHCRARATASGDIVVTVRGNSTLIFVR